MESFFDRLLAADHAEAYGWLMTAPPGTQRTLGEAQTPAASVELVQHLYALGAATVLAMQIDRDPVSGFENTGHLLVRLPDKSAARAKLFEAEREIAEAQGYDGEVDRGLPYLYLKLD